MKRRTPAGRDPGAPVSCPVRAEPEDEEQSFSIFNQVRLLK